MYALPLKESIHIYASILLKRNNTEIGRLLFFEVCLWYKPEKQLDKGHQLMGFVIHVEVYVAYE